MPESSQHPPEDLTQNSTEISPQSPESYVAKHKLGCLFFFLANITPQFQSTLKAINLIPVGKTVDVKVYGLHNFLLPFVKELKVLYCDGIFINMHSFNHTFFGGLLAFLPYNLAAHAVGGFKESISFSQRLCRSCMIMILMNLSVL